MDEACIDLNVKRGLDLFDESDRGAAIVGAALLEDTLATLLKDNMSSVAMSQKQVRDIFDLSGPLSNFSAKISIAFAFAFIDKVTFNDLQIVRRIRNSFAHSAGKLSFADVSIASQVQNMYCFRYAKDQLPFFSSECKLMVDEHGRSYGELLPFSKAAFSIAIQHLQTRVMFSSTIRKMRQDGIELPLRFIVFKDIYDS